MDGRKVPADVLSTASGVFVFEKDPSGMSDIAACPPDIEKELRCAEAFDIQRKLVVPGFADVHVHFREPGLSYKETIKTGTLAAARGGYSVVCPMPNIDPAPEDLDKLRVELGIIERDALIKTIPYGTITRLVNGKRELSDMERMAPFVCAYSDDGKGVQTGDLMRDAMELAKSLGKLIVAHCEDESLVEPGGCIHDGRYAREHGLVGISSASEWRQVERDVKLADETGCAYHVCHVSTKESVEIIREAKKSGVNVTFETAPHYLMLTEDDLMDEGRFKMNPPVRERADRDALLEAAADGTLDIIATDHAPHTAEEKSHGLEKSPFGIVGLEVSFPVLYTGLVEGGVIGLERLIELMSVTPRKRFGLPGAEALGADGLKEIVSESAGGGCEGNVSYDDVKTGMKRIARDLTVLDTECEHTIDSSSFASMGRATPFDGMKVRGKVAMTVADGKVVFGD